MFREGWVLEVLHDDFFIDEATVSLLHSIKGKKRKYLLSYYEYDKEESQKEQNISEEQAVKWILEKYTSKDGSTEGLKEEKMYMLHLMGIGATKIGEYFGVSRQTVHKKIKSFEDNRLQKL